jgi:hypothetical protein
MQIFFLKWTSNQNYSFGSFKFQPVLLRSCGLYLTGICLHCIRVLHFLKKNYCAVVLMRRLVWLCSFLKVNRCYFTYGPTREKPDEGIKKLHSKLKSCTNQLLLAFNYGGYPLQFQWIQSNDDLTWWSHRLRKYQNVLFAAASPEYNLFVFSEFVVFLKSLTLQITEQEAPTGK